MVPKGIKRRLAITYSKNFKIFSLAVAAIGLFVLIGWALNISLLTTLLPGLASMKANTALCFLFLGLALYLPTAKGGWRKPASFALALLVLLIASLTLSQDIFSLDLGLDQFLFADRSSSIATTAAGRMSAPTSFSFVLLSLVLMLSERLKENQRQIPILIALFIASGVFTSYPFSLVFGSSLFSYTGMALHTAILLVVLSLILLFEKPATGWLAVIGSRTPQGNSTRSLLVTALLTPFVLGWLIFYGETSGWYPAGLSRSTFVVSVMLLLAIAVTYNSQRLVQTEKARALLEVDFREVQRQLEAFVEFSPSAVFIKDVSGSYKLVNKHFEQLVGKPRIQILERNASALFSGPVLEAVLGSDKKVIETKGTALTEITVPFEGEQRTYLNTKFPLLDPDGSVNSIAGIWTDITGQRALTDALSHANEALRESEERFTKAFHLSPVGVALTTLSDGRFIDINLSFSEIFGLTREEAIGKTSTELGILTGEAREKVISEIRGKGLVHNLELSFTNPKVGSRDILYSVETVKIGEEQCALSAVIDITERKEAEEKLKKSNQDLARSNSELEQFAYVASHDLQEPLRMVSSYMQLLETRYRDKLDQDAKDFIDYAVDGANRMQGLIQDLLSFSRVGTRGKTPEPFDSQAALDEALQNLRMSVEESKANIQNDVLPWVIADGNQLVQVFQNLVGNAIKFSGTKTPDIRISAKKMNDLVEFAIRDNGIGFDPKHADRIFVIFQRLNNRQEFQGTGIGLAICKKIVERHGGRIWVESEPDKGSTFHFTFPLAPEPAPDQAPRDQGRARKEEAEPVEDRAGRLV